MEEWNLESGWPPSRATTNILLPSPYFGRPPAENAPLSSFRRRAPQECHPEWENGVQRRESEKRRRGGANDLYRRAKTKKLRGATAFKPHLSRVMAVAAVQQGKESAWAK